MGAGADDGVGVAGDTAVEVYVDGGAGGVPPSEDMALNAEGGERPAVAVSGETQGVPRGAGVDPGEQAAAVVPGDAGCAL